MPINKDKYKYHLIHKQRTVLYKLIKVTLINSMLVSLFFIISLSVVAKNANLQQTKQVNEFYLTEIESVSFNKVLQTIETSSVKPEINVINSTFGVAQFSCFANLKNLDRNKSKFCYTNPKNPVL